MKTAPAARHQVIRVWKNFPMLARPVLAALVGCLMLAVGDLPASALSCALRPVEEDAASSTAVFSGTFIAYEVVGERDPLLSYTTAVSTYAVDRVYKGKLESEVKILTGGSYGEWRGNPALAANTSAKVLIYAVDVSSTTTHMQERLVQVDRELEEFQRQFQEAEALRKAAPDPKAIDSKVGEELDTAWKGIGELEPQRNGLQKQLTALAVANATLGLAQCRRGVESGPIPEALGRGVEPKGEDTEVPPQPTPWPLSRLPAAWPVGVVAISAGVLIWTLFHRRRRS